MIIICCGLPRSGSTLQFNIVREIVSKKSATVLDWVPASELKSKLSAVGEAVVLAKTHYLTDDILEMGNDVCFVSCARDPRDVAVSNLDAFGNSVEKTIVDLSRCVDSLISAKRDAKGFYLSSYNKLRYEMKVEIKSISQYLDIEIEDEGIDNIFKKLNVESLRRVSENCKSNDLFSIIKRRARFLFKMGPVYQNADLRLHPNHIGKNLGEEGHFIERLTLGEQEQMKVALSKKYADLGFEVAWDLSKSND